MGGRGSKTTTNEETNIVGNHVEETTNVYNDNRVINQNTYNNFCFTGEGGASNPSQVIAWQLALSKSDEYLKSLTNGQDDPATQKQKIIEYIEEGLHRGLTPTTMVNTFKQFNRLNQWQLNEDLFDHTYAEYFITPFHKVQELEKKLKELGDKVEPPAPAEAAPAPLPRPLPILPPQLQTHLPLPQSLQQHSETPNEALVRHMIYKVIIEFVFRDSQIE
eukprot:TRINITY_DN24371_c0_g1_i1.p1 TRINITY_DN24371_c0_g1~~TRINITY_DN24371_c0_g1_i1.p1  ORF type:complete len:219 (-),score=36.71 TRINITY_DN24371_c0_g1_i1:125-781(-)